MRDTAGGHRRAISALISAVLHVALLLAFAATSIQLANRDEPRIIPLTILETAPPPPPGAAPPDAATGATNVPPVPADVPKIAPQAVPQPDIPAQPDKLKIAAKPKPTLAVARARPTPQAAAPAAPIAASAPPAASEPAAGAPGVVDGVAGGRIHGKVGGRLAGSGDELFALDQVAVAPKLLDKVVPTYPALARARSQEGVVKLSAIIGRSGEVERDSVRVVDSAPPFDTPAVDAVQRWRYAPGRDEAGTAVRVQLTVNVRFQLRGE
jgi:protein TonB